MKRHLIFISLFLIIMTFGQSKITVYNVGERVPLTNTTVSCNKKILGQTNSAGQLEFRSNCKEVSVSSTGFYEDKVVVDKVMEITL